MSFRIAAALALILLIGTAFTNAQPSFSATAVAATLQKPDDLPEGEGKQVLIDACSECHEVKEVTKFAGIYGPEEWRDLVKTMVVYGAQITSEQEDQLVEYLNKHFGKK